MGAREGQEHQELQGISRMTPQRHLPGCGGASGSPAMQILGTASPWPSCHFNLLSTLQSWLQSSMGESPYLCMCLSHCLGCSSLPSSLTKHLFIIQVFNQVPCSEIPSLNTNPTPRLVMFPF